MHRWVLVITMIVATPAPVAAFTRLTVTDHPDRFLWQGNSTLTMWPAIDSSEDLSPSEVEDALNRAAANWMVHPCTDVVFVFEGPPSTPDTIAITDATDGENEVVFREDEWLDDPAAFAITYSKFSTRTGEILESDIVVNGVDWSFTGSDARSVEVDLESVLTHELGHVLGFDHTDDPESTMYGAGQVGETKKRDLTEDDIHGLCTVYSPRGVLRSGLRSGTITSGCAAGGQALPVTSSLALALLVLFRRRG
ncbi:MAG: M57 family metalloprotease [Myxococcota bacterium]